MAETVKVLWDEGKAFDYQKFDAQAQNTAWASNVVGYAWVGEDGDVGRAEPLIEKLLFGSQKSRAGNDMEALQLTVGIEGPKKIHPIGNVSIMSFVAASKRVDMTVRRGWSPSNRSQQHQALRLRFSNCHPGLLHPSCDSRQ